MALLVFVIANFLVVKPIDRYLASSGLPPSFRHMDRAGIDLMIADYLKAKSVDENTVAVVGDCITFGHGVKFSYVNHLQEALPQKSFINISMQSLPLPLLLYIFDEIRKRGIKKVLFQLHPFGGYVDGALIRIAREEMNDSEKKLLDKFRADPSSVSNDEKKVILSRLSEEFRKYFVHDALTREWPKEPWMRSVLGILDQPSRWLHSVPLFHGRFLLDHGYGFERSIFSNRQNRIDSYKAPLKEARQISIIKKKADFFARFKKERAEGFFQEMKKGSMLLLVLEYARLYDLEVQFFMAPTFADKVIAHSPLTEQDWANRIQGYRMLFERYKVNFYDFNDHPKLVGHMRHFDNITIDGHRELGAIVRENIQF